VFFKRHIFPRTFFTPLGYSLPHFVVHIFQKHFAPRRICIEKCEVPRELPPPRSHLLDKIGTKFQRLLPCFWGHGTIGNTVRRNRTSEIQDGGLQSGNTFISTYRHDSNNILTAIPMFSLIVAKWPMPPQTCKLCTGKARKPYWAERRLSHKYA